MNISTLKSTLSDMASGAIERFGDTLSDGRDAVSETTHSVGEDVTRAASRLLRSEPASAISDRISTLAKVIAAAGSMKAIADSINPEVPVRWALRAMGLRREPSMAARVLTGVGLIAAGAAVGAGAALLFAPHTGTQTRAMLNRRFRSLRRDAKGVVDEVGAKATEVVHDVEAKAKDIAESAETSAREAVRKVTDGTEESTRGGSSGSSTRPRNPGISHRTPKEG